MSNQITSKPNSPATSVNHASGTRLMLTTLTKSPARNFVSNLLFFKIVLAFTSSAEILSVRDLHRFTVSHRHRVASVESSKAGNIENRTLKGRRNLYFELAKHRHRGIITASDVISQFKQLSVIRNPHEVLRALTGETGRYNAGTAVPHNGLRTR